MLTKLATGFIGAFRCSVAAVLFSGCVDLKAQSTNPPNLISERAVELKVNSASTTMVIPVLLVEGLGWLLPIEEFNKLGLTNAKPYIVYRGEEDWVSIGRTKGLGLVFNEGTQELNLLVPVSQFGTRSINLEPEKKSANLKKGWGGYFNYDLSASRTTGVTSGSRSDGAGTIELVMFSPWGSFVTQHLARYESGIIQNNANADTRLFSRLDTYWQQDFPDLNLRLRVGDNISSAGSFGRAVRYGGIRLGTDFSLQPDLVTLPGLSVSGSSAVPSTVDVFVNGARQGRFTVAPGQFTLDRIPVVSGGGNIRLVVNNVLGQEQLIEVPFFRPANQLKQGLWDYSIDLGVQRQDFAISGAQSDNYGDRFASSNFRYGLTNQITTEGRLEWASDHSLVGLGFLAPIGNAHQINHSISVSRSTSSGAPVSGWAAGLGYSFSGQLLRFAGRIESASRNFSQLGYGTEEVAAKRRIQFNTGFRVGTQSNFGLAFVRTDFYETAQSTLSSQSVLSMSASTRLSRSLLMSLNLSRIHQESERSTFAGLQLFWSTDSPFYGSVASQFSDGSTGSSRGETIRYGRRSINNAGLSWDIEASGNSLLRGRAGYLGDSGQVSFDVARYPGGDHSQRVSANGAIVVLPGSMTPSRSIDDSFIVVEADPSLAAKIEQPGGRRVPLNQAGRAVIARVQPYREQSVRVVADELPIDVKIDQATATATVPSRAGAKLTLGLSRIRPFTFKLVAFGKAPPSGTRIVVNGSPTIVGLEGLVFAENGRDTNQIEYSSQGRTCRVEVKMDSKELHPDLGEVRCD